MKLKHNKTKITQYTNNNNFNMKMTKNNLSLKGVLQRTCLLPIVELLVC